MILDVQDEGALAQTTAELCIVGGGAAGLTLAHALRDCGLSIVLLESGAETLDRDVNTLSEGFVAPGSAHPEPSLYRQRGLGGSTRIWGGRCVPYDPLDFEARPGLREGWPIAYEEVARFYPAAMDYCQAGEPDFDAASALKLSRPFIAGFEDDAVLTRSLERFSLPTDFGKRLRRDLATADGVRILTRATCVRIGLDPAASSQDLTVARPDGSRFILKAKTTVVAVGGLETVRLLGVSAPSHSPIHQALGRYYMCHMEGALGELRLSPRSRPVAFGFERTRDGVYARRRLTLSDDTLRGQGLLNIMARLHHPNVVDPRHRIGVLSAMYMTKRLILPEYRRKLSMVEHSAAAGMTADRGFWAAHARNLVADLPRTAAFAADWTVRRYMMKRRIPYVALRSATGAYVLDFNAEQLPHHESRVSLAHETDRLGTPKLRIDWRFTAADVDSVARSYRIMRDAFARSGAATLVLPQALEEAIQQAALPVGGHHIGAARMSNAAGQGVVDRDCRVHGAPAEIYVCGSASFPTSGHANPTLTIVAMALRLAETLKRRLAEGKA